MFDSVSTIEAIYNLIGVIPMLSVGYNLINAIADWVVIKREGVNSNIRSAAIDSLNTNAVFAVIVAALMTIGITAAFTPARPDVQFRWTSIISGCSFIVIYVAVFYGSIRETISRIVAISSYQRKGETLVEALQRQKLKRRRADDVLPYTRHSDTSQVTTENKPVAELTLTKLSEAGETYVGTITEVAQLPTIADGNEPRG